MKRHCILCGCLIDSKEDDICEVYMDDIQEGIISEVNDIESGKQSSKEYNKKVEQ